MLKPSNAALKIREEDKFRFNELEVSPQKSKSLVKDKSPIISLKTKIELDQMSKASRASKVTLQSLNSLNQKKRNENTKSLKSINTISNISRKSKLSRSKTNPRKLMSKTMQTSLKTAMDT
jgi:hypothetical protein